MTNNEIKDIICHFKSTTKSMNYEIEKLKNLIDFFDIEEVFNRNDKLKELQQRIDKAITLLEEKIPFWEEWYYDGRDCGIEERIHELLKILKGEDKDKE